MKHMPDGSYHYIAHYMDHWSKFHILWPLMKKSAVDVAVGLVKRVFPYLGLPKILQSDNGREIVNEIVKEVVRSWPGEVVKEPLYFGGRCCRSHCHRLGHQSA